MELVSFFGWLVGCHQNSKVGYLMAPRIPNGSKDVIPGRALTRSQKRQNIYASARYSGKDFLGKLSPK